MVTYYNWIRTSESFIFSLNIDSLYESIVSFVADSQHAVFESPSNYPRFGIGTDLHFGGKYAKPYSKKLSYQTAIRPTSNNFEWEDWEVFSFVKMK